MFDLIVRIPFAGFRVGQRITDRALVELHDASPYVTRVMAEKPPRHPVPPPAARPAPVEPVLPEARPVPKKKEPDNG